MAPAEECESAGMDKDVAIRNVELAMELVGIGDAKRCELPWPVSVLYLSGDHSLVSQDALHFDDPRYNIVMRSAATMYDKAS
jgi:hypothetical protein